MDCYCCQSLFFFDVILAYIASLFLNLLICLDCIVFLYFFLIFFLSHHLSLSLSLERNRIYISQKLLVSLLSRSEKQKNDSVEIFTNDPATIAAGGGTFLNNIGSTTNNTTEQQQEQCCWCCGCGGIIDVVIIDVIIIVSIIIIVNVPNTALVV